jgi:hypothetical protein
MSWHVLLTAQSAVRDSPNPTNQHLMPHGCHPLCIMLGSSMLVLLAYRFVGNGIAPVAPVAVQKLASMLLEVRDGDVWGTGHG